MSESDNPDNPEYEYQVRFSRSEACDASGDIFVNQEGYSRRDALERARKRLVERHSATDYPYTNIEPVDGDYPDRERFSREDQQYAIGAYLMGDLSIEEATRAAGLSDEVFQDMLKRAGVEVENDE